MRVYFDVIEYDDGGWGIGFGRNKVEAKTLRQAFVRMANRIKALSSEELIEWTKEG